MLIQTTREKRHKHIGFITPTGEIFLAESGAGKKKHTHLVARIAVEGEGGMQEEIIEVQEVNDHVHEIAGQYIYKSNEKNQTEEDAVGRVYQLWKDASDYEKGSRESGYESESFKYGDQWDASAEAKLIKEKRACHVVNKTLGKLDMLSGIQRQSRTDMHFKPTHESTEEVAQAINMLVKNVLTENGFEYEETDVFEDMCNVGRGIFNLYMGDGIEDDQDIRIEAYPWSSCRFGPHLRKDAADLEFMVKDKYLSTAKTKQLFPDKADELDSYVSMISNNDISDTSDTKRIGDYNDVLCTGTYNEETLYNIAKKDIRVLECWLKEYKRYIRVGYLDRQTGESIVKDYKGMSDADFNALKTIPQIDVKKLNATEFRVTKVAGNVLLEDEIKELPDGANTFPMVPAYAYKRGNIWMGKIEPVKDLQRGINKRRSQITDAANSMSGHGWFTDSQTFESPDDENRFKETSSSSGWVQKIADLGRIPVKIEGGQIPAELINLEERESADLAELMNIQPPAPRQESGIAMMERARQGAMGNEFLFDNMDLAKGNLGKMIVAYIQKYYTPQKMVKIIRHQAQQDKVTEKEMPLLQQQNEAIMQILTDTDLTKYSVAVSKSKHTATMREQNFMVWMQGAMQGLPVDPSFLIQLSDLPDKDKMMALAGESAQNVERHKAAELRTQVVVPAVANQQMPWEQGLSLIEGKPQEDPNNGIPNMPAGNTPNYLE